MPRPSADQNISLHGRSRYSFTPRVEADFRATIIQFLKRNPEATLEGIKSCVGHRGLPTLDLMVEEGSVETTEGRPKRYKLASPNL